MYSKMLVPLDGSRLSERVLSNARFMATGLKVPVELLRVIDPHVIDALIAPENGRYLDIVSSEMKKESLDYLGSVAKTFTDAASVHCSVDFGSPAQVIVNRAAVQTGTLVAMSTHGRSGAQRWLLGSVADCLELAWTRTLVLLDGASPVLISMRRRQASSPEGWIDS